MSDEPPESATTDPGAGEPAGEPAQTSDRTTAAPAGTDSTATEPAGPDEQADGSPGAPRRPLVFAGLAAGLALLLGALGFAGYLFVREQNTAELLAAHEEVRQAACRYAPVLANYDAENLDPYFSAVLAGATGDWKKEFETTTTELREALTAGQVVSTADDIQCAVKSADATTAEAVVVIEQTITSLGTKGQPAPGQLAMVMRMEKTDGRWLVNQMNTVL
ncbi:hypothetical protein [Nocardia sp. X0981]